MIFATHLQWFLSPNLHHLNELTLSPTNHRTALVDFSLIPTTKLQEEPSPWNSMPLGNSLMLNETTFKRMAVVSVATKQDIWLEIAHLPTTNTQGSMP
jgi:hypothetical protein